MPCTLQGIWLEKWKESIRKVLTRRVFPMQPNDKSWGEVKKKKTVDTRDSRRKQCIICSQIKYEGSRDSIRIEDIDRDKNFVNFSKGILYTHYVMYKSPKDILAADIMCYRKCRKSYLSQFKRDVQVFLDADKNNDNDFFSENDLQKSLLDNMMSLLKLETSYYAVINVRDILNKKLQAKGIGNYTSVFPL